MAVFFLSAVVKQSDGSFAVCVPDLPAVTGTGAGMDEALTAASEGIAVYLHELADNGQDIPVPSDQKTAVARLKEMGIAAEDPQTALRYISAPNPDDEVVSIKIRLTRGLLKEIEAGAKEMHMSRDELFASAADAYITRT